VIQNGDNITTVLSANERMIAK